MTEDQGQSVQALVDRGRRGRAINFSFRAPSALGVFASDFRSCLANIQNEVGTAKLRNNRARVVRDSVGVTADGRITIDIGTVLQKQFSVLTKIQTCTTLLPTSASQSTPIKSRPKLKLNIVIHCVGSRGDVQPFIALGSRMLKDGHRIRLASHDLFADSTRASGIDFFPVGGDPADLMAYMVKNPGLLPSMTSLLKGDVQRNRAMIAGMLQRFWRSCVDRDPVTGKPFVADAIIANPPSFAHIHCAEAAGIPLHMVFTMPWTNTKAFPHPLANITRYNVTSRETANFMSYSIVEWMTWQGLHDVINSFRRSLDLERIPSSAGPNLITELAVPVTYCWSRFLIPKPSDWPAHIDISGFIFREPPDFTPPSDLDAFLSSGPAPVYIGFGSIVIDNPECMTRIILDAVQATSVRAVISRGWSNLGGPPVDGVIYIDDCPHEWLFQHVAAVIHHGGAGTAACGLRNGCPTLVVPFFGDQPFWGESIASAGAGPRPIHHTQLNKDNLSDGIRFCLSPDTTKAAKIISDRIRDESGVDAAALSFNTHLPHKIMQCDLLGDRSAAWTYRRGGHRVKLSVVAAEMLIQNGSLQEKHLKLYKSCKIDVESRRVGPLYGPTAALIRTIITLFTLLFNMGLKPGLRAVKNVFLVILSFLMAVVEFVALSPLYCFKGGMVDFAFALVEGLRGAPQLWGKERVNYGQLRNWTDGFKFAGKCFWFGYIDAICGLVMHPYEGAYYSGVLGFFTGLLFGILEFIAKILSSSIGLYAYPAIGISRSISKLFRRRTGRKLRNRRLLEGKYLSQRGQTTNKEKEAIILKFHDIMGK
ncbi:glycosyltransferase family 1 protein [Penicillium atrosanguineum]|uniref:Glycosyltransferase family 1 protein n=1 Tax=Penicillium atrosanguineum TaxID=1132637 RepID=A0A9W9U0H4_9EURO|nr:glycosyltransferase family 1 protein [Penicillium atrosanguineum]